MKEVITQAAERTVGTMHEKTRHIRCFGRCIRDMIQFTPFLFWGDLLTSILLAILHVWQPVLIAELFELAPGLNDGNMILFKRKIIYLCVCIGFPAVCPILLRVAGLYGEGRKEKTYGWNMYRYALQIRLEALESKEVLDRFRKADEAYSNYPAHSRLFSYLMLDLESLLVCVSTIFVVSSFSVWLLPGAILGVLPHLFIDLFFERRRSNAYRGQSAKRRRLQYLWRLFSRKEPVKEMRTMGFQGYLQEKWVQANVEVVQEMEELELKSMRLSAVGVLAKNGCYVANVAIALLLMLRGELAVGQFAACLTAFGLLQDNLFILSAYVVQFLSAYHHVEEYYDFFRTEIQEAGGEKCCSFEREITMEDVHFRYPGAEKDALDGVNLTIKKGEHVVIVGVNGSGKTTLSKVLTGAYRTASEKADDVNCFGNTTDRAEERPVSDSCNVYKKCNNENGRKKRNDEKYGYEVAAEKGGIPVEKRHIPAEESHIPGRVYYDDQDISKVRKEELYRKISLVQQDFIHYNFSLRENIGISDFLHMEDEARFRRVTEAVGMQELVQSIGGLDTQLGREFGGRELSGGEWQKVAIARGLFRDCELIVLDEPTSALDPLVEYEILTGFLELIRGKTSIIISHRVGICRHADKVVVMKDGKVVECGSHEALKSAGGEYARIWREQAKWY